MLNAIIIDDEPLAHNVILYLLENHCNLSVIGRFFNAKQALDFISSNKVDVLFLDINMPELSGIEMLKMLTSPPKAIVITAHHEYAIHGYDLDVVDYLLKPIDKNRFNKAILKLEYAYTRNDIKSNEINDQKYIFLKVGRGSNKFVIDDIDYIEAYGNFVKVWQNSESKLVSSTLKKLLSLLPKSNFIQIHKSYAINRKKIQKIDLNSVTLTNGCTLKVTRSFKENIKIE